MQALIILIIESSHLKTEEDKPIEVDIIEPEDAGNNEIKQEETTEEDGFTW